MVEQIHDKGDEGYTGIRLPSNVAPKHYDLRLKTNLEEFTFEGTVKIDLLKASNFNKITLHALELEISDGYATCEQQHPLRKVVYNEDNGTASLIFDDHLKGVQSIFLKFKGILNNQLKGFYRTSFKLADQEVYAAVTQFEATDARRCFPCWDEPSIKASFSVSLVYSNKPSIPGTNYNLVPLSNMPIVSQSPGDTEDELVAVFEKSPIMSTYLLAFAIGPFDYIEGSDGKRPIRVYTTPGKKEHGRFALDVACKALIFFEEYFNMPYPLPKMDMLALPDFASGAMENWGLVTYRETALLVDPNNTSTSSKQWIALVVSHEFAHQWFGNLVTMEWWTHLWLNEGFATFMEFLCVDHILPEYRIWPQFITHTQMAAMDLDSLHSSHPIEVPVKHPSEIDEIFDSISYNKGASVIRMLYHYIGDDCFRKGMNDYLTRFAYKNAVTEDLWDALGAASNKPVREIMTSWTSQTGYPWLSVSLSKADDKTRLSITQSKFTADGKLSPDEEDVSWIIPVSASISGKDTISGLISSKNGSLNLGQVSTGWIKLNPDNIGLYRTVYPDAMLLELQQAILDQTLQPLDRLGLQDDCFALCEAGKVSTVDLMKLLQAYKGERDYNVWASINNCLGRLSSLLYGFDCRDKLHQLGNDLYSEVFKHLSWTPKPDESHTDALLRSIVINRLISFGEQSVISEAKEKFKNLELSPIPADLRGAVYKAISAYGDDTMFDKLFDIHRTTELHEEKNRVLSALASTKQEARLKRVIDFVFSDEVRDQDRVTGIGSIGVNHPPVAWKIFMDKKDFFRSIYGCNHLIRYTVKYCTENFVSEKMATEIEQFFKENKFPGTERTVQQSLEKIRLKAAWLERDSDKIKVFLSNQ